MENSIDIKKGYSIKIDSDCLISILEKEVHIIAKEYGGDVAWYLESGSPNGFKKLVVDYLCSNTLIDINDFLSSHEDLENAYRAAVKELLDRIALDLLDTLYEEDAESIELPEEEGSLKAYIEGYRI